MTGGIFISGTDTGVGKTIVTGLLLRLFTRHGIKAITQKWVQTGSGDMPVDVMEHMRFSRENDKYIRKYGAYMAPYTLKLAASPHLASSAEGKNIESSVIEDSFKRLSKEFDMVLAEGTGGCMVPINENEILIDIAHRLDMPVLIVAANRLGAINHTVLTVEAVRKRGLDILGIIFNRLPGSRLPGSRLADTDNTILEDNKRIIARITGEKVLGELLYSDDRDKLCEAFAPIGEKMLGMIK